MFDYLANPTRFMRLADRLLRPLALLATALILAGLYYGLFDSPPDYQQGETVRIMYVHVPAAWLASLGYVALGRAGFSMSCGVIRLPMWRCGRWRRSARCSPS